MAVHPTTRLGMYVVVISFEKNRSFKFQVRADMRVWVRKKAKKREGERKREAREGGYLLSRVLSPRKVTAPYQTRKVCRPYLP
jgi:ribosomal protein L11